MLSVRPYLPFRDPQARLRDINESITQIEEFIHGMDLREFLRDPKAQAAVERKLLVLNHAALKLGEEAEKLCPGIPWTAIRGMGKWLQQQYDRVNPEAVWNTVANDLPQLRASIERALA